MTSTMWIPKGSSQESISAIYRDINTDVKLGLIQLCFDYCKHGDVKIRLTDGRIRQVPNISDDELFRLSDPDGYQRVNDICDAAIRTGNMEDVLKLNQECDEKVKELELREKQYASCLESIRLCEEAIAKEKNVQ